MDADRFFLLSESTLRGVVDGLQPDELDLPVPREWTRRGEVPTLRDVLFAHTYDEAWVPAVLAGGAVADGDPFVDADLLGDDPVAAYDARNDAAVAAVESSYDPAATLRFSYGDYPAKEGITHLAQYRALQAWAIAKLVGRPIRLSDELLDGFEQFVLPEIELWRSYGVYQAPVEVPDDADRETRILGELGLWRP